MTDKPEISWGVPNGHILIADKEWLRLKQERDELLGAIIDHLKHPGQRSNEEMASLIERIDCG